MWLMTIYSIVHLVACRKHYTVDVILGSYFAYFVSGWYHVRALNRSEGDTLFGRIIRRLEDWSEDGKRGLGWDSAFGDNVFGWGDWEKRERQSSYPNVDGEGEENSRLINSTSKV